MEEEDSGSESEEDPSGTLPEGDRAHTTQLVQNVVVCDMVNKAILLQKERIRLLHTQAEVVKRGHPAIAGPPLRLRGTPLEARASPGAPLLMEAVSAPPGPHRAPNSATRPWSKATSGPSPSTVSGPPKMGHGLMRTPTPPSWHLASQKGGGEASRSLAPLEAQPWEAQVAHQQVPGLPEELQYDIKHYKLLMQMYTRPDPAIQPVIDLEDLVKQVIARTVSPELMAQCSQQVVPESSPDQMVNIDYDQASIAALKQRFEGVVVSICNAMCTRGLWPRAPPPYASAAVPPSHGPTHRTHTGGHETTLSPGAQGPHYRDVVPTQPQALIQGRARETLVGLL
jgi:hypothetical protein